jgi:hypothetical protein
MKTILTTRIARWNAIVLGGALVATASVQGGAPRISDIRPLGVQRGVTSEVTISGGDLGENPRLFAPFGRRIEPVDAKRSNAGSWTFKVSVAPEAAVGVYVIRVQTDRGLSNPFLFAVGQLVQVTEKEDNSTFETAQALTSVPIVVEGQASGNDVDYYKFMGKKGTKIVIDAQCARIGSGVDPSIRLTTAGSSRRFVASADDSPGLLTDARLVAELPEDSEYVVEISDSRYQGGGRPVYRLLIGPVPMAEEIYPLGGRIGETLGLELRGGTLGGLRVAAVGIAPMDGTSLHVPRINCPMLDMAPAVEQARDVESLHPLGIESFPDLREPADPAAAPVRAVAPVVFSGRIDPPGDEDRFVVAAAAGQRLHVSVEASDLGSALDGVLQVLGSKGSVIANADDTPIPGTAKKGMPASGLVSPDPSLDLTIPGGTSEVTLALRDLEGRGGIGFPYRIVVTPVFPTFEVEMIEPQVSIPRGGSSAIGVALVRKDYSGPVTLTVANPPPGFTVRPGTIAAGQTVGALSLSASPTANFSSLFLKLVARGESPDGPIEVEAVKHMVFAKQETLSTNGLTQKGLAAAAVLPAAVAISAPAGPLEVAHGFAASVPMTVVRAKDADAALAITALPMPPGLSVPAASIAAKAVTGSVVVKAAVESPLGLVTIAFEAKGTFAGEDQTIGVPAVALNLVPPAEIELTAKGVEIKPGGTAEIKGKVHRKGPFNEPVTVRLTGLPAGLNTQSVTVAAGASDFTVKISADSKAASSTADARVTSAYQVNKKDYPTAPVPLSVKVLPAK